MAVAVEPVFPPQVLTWEELPLLTVEAELPHWEGKRAFCRYYAAWGRGLLDYGRRVLLPQLAERCRRALEQGGMLPLTTAALRSRIVRETEHGVSICTELTGPWPYRCRGDVWADGLPVGLGECFPPHALWRRCLRETAQERGLVLHPGDFWLGEEGLLLPGSRPSGGYEVVCLPYDPELGPLDPLGL
ncbi:hypothetical protein [Vescimonas sp.]